MEFPKMNKQMKSKWLKALRSGKYKQGQNVLCSSHYSLKTKKEEQYYCCLGVLNEVCALNNSTGRAFLCSDTEEKIGITHNVQEELSYMNDGLTSKYNPRGRKMKFTTIANWIEKNL